MSVKDRNLTSDDVFAKPHHLCRCCKRLAGTFAQIYPEMRKRKRRLCPRYDKVQDLVYGATGGCHLCILTIEDIKRRLEFEEEAWPTCLRASTEAGANDESGCAEISSYLTANAKAFDIILKIRHGIGTEEEAEISSFLDVEVRDLLPTTEATWPDCVGLAQLSRHTGANAHYSLIRKWLNECTDKALHPACNITDTIRRPTRLLDLAHYREDVRLIEGEHSDAPYAALSYCWGLIPQLMLLRTNIEQFRVQMPLTQLSTVARDAIAVCRKLSIPYLWIDALCIIQGKDGDFLTEAPRMGDVYGGSALTIVAASSKDTTEPFLVSRNPLEWLDCKLNSTDNGATEDHWVTPDTYCEDGEPGDYHIDTRAWCLQERLLSPRSIYFGKKGIHWECRKGIACELRPDIERNHNNLVIGNHDTYGLKSEYAELQSLQPECAADVSRAELIWRHILKAYSEMNITHIGDKLIAVAGIASVLQSKFHWTSTYGMWIEFLVPELLWESQSRDFPDKHEAITRQLPSWSWTSSNGHPFRTEYPRQLSHRNHGADDLYFATVVSWPRDCGFEIILLQNPTEKRLCIKGLLVPVKDTWTQVEDNQPDHPPPHGKRSGYSRAYHPDPNTGTTNLFALLLMCQKFPGDLPAKHRNYGITLIPVDAAHRCYRRTGIILEYFSYDYYPNPPDAQLVQGKFLTDMWAPVGREQEVCII